MPQNIYDNDVFFEGYSQLLRSREGLDGAPEWPALRALLPELRGRDVLDLGCGFGWFCRWAREQGAAQVLGIDVSEKMLARAKADTKDAAITYTQANADRLDLAAASFDLVYSSLALHYIEDLQTLITTLHRSLRPGGSFVFSAEHPIFTAPSHPGWSVDADGRKTWPVNRYLDEGPRTTNWLAQGVIKQHRTIGTYITMLLRAGFSIAHVEEWAASEADIVAHPAWANERERPSFLLVAARKA